MQDTSRSTLRFLLDHNADPKTLEKGAYMITEIGIVAGKVLELMEKRNGVLVFGEIHTELKHHRDMVLMGLGWLLLESYVHIMEDPSTSAYRDNDRNRAIGSTAGVFDLVVGDKVIIANSKRIKNVPDHIGVVVGKTLVLLEACGGLLDLRTIENNINEHRDMVLMGLGWLIREGYVKGNATAHGILLDRLPKEMASTKILAYS